MNELAQRYNSMTVVETFAYSSRIFRRLAELVELADSEEKLNALFDQMLEPSILEEKLMLATMKYLPQIARFWIKQFATGALKELPGPPGGRPRATDEAQNAEIVACVVNLFGKGVSLETSKKRAALRFGVSETTVQRIWDNRATVGEADFSSALKWISDLDT
jgi:hypothetical protein